MKPQAAPPQRLVTSQPSLRITWALALIGPLLTSTAALLWWDATPQRCVGIGQTVAGGAPAVGWLLLLGAPLATAWYGGRGRRWALRVIPAVIVSLAAAVVFGFVAWQVWWVSGHGCYT